MISPLCCSYFGYALPFIGRPPWLRDFYYWYGFFSSFALLYEPSGVGDCKGPYALTGPLMVCLCGPQHWGATQHTHNHACSRTVYVLHSRVVTLEGKQCWLLRSNKWTFTLIAQSCNYHVHYQHNGGLTVWKAQEILHSIAAVCATNAQGGFMPEA